ncbi:putative transposable element [Trichonephila clavipes]|nr:putative transposable element [Trichonephila clavipes]
MGVEPGEFSVSAMKLLDRKRLMKAIYAFSGRSKKIRKDKRRKRKKEEDNMKKNKRYRTLNCNKTTMYYSIDMNFFYSKDNLVALHFKYDQARHRFVEWAQKEIAVIPDFHKRILFSDEAHFWLNGYVNKQNCHIWSESNPQVYVETPLHPETLTIWCALWAGGIIGPYFFKTDEGHNVKINARATIDLLKDTFGDRLISRFGPANWPPRSCDLTLLDYFLAQDYVKSLVYADNPQTLDHLEDNIRRVITDIRPQMLEKVIENRTSRLDYIRASRGSSMPEIIFKIPTSLQYLSSHSFTDDIRYEASERNLISSVETDNFIAVKSSSSQISITVQLSFVTIEECEPHLINHGHRLRSVSETSTELSA